MALMDSIEDASGIPIPFLLIVVAGVFFGVAYQVSSSFLFNILNIALVLTPLWLPPVLIVVFWKVWVTSLRAKFIANQEYKLLEIRIPREINKSPLAMEAVLNGMHQGAGETTWFDRYVQGKIRTWFSLELVSIDGEVRFFIWTRAFFKNIVEAQVYAQYPEVEIYEVDDYTTGVTFDPNTTGVWGCDFKLVKPDPYPIKTYVDYGLDKDPKEEQKVDPLSSVLEYLGACGKGHQIWIQILIRVNKNERHKKGTWFGKTGWRNEAKDEVEKIRKSATQTMGEDGFPMMLLTPGQQDTLKAIERSVAKLGFDCGIRGIYIAEKDKFNATNIVGLLGTVKQFNSNMLNGFTPTRWMIPFDYPWQDYKKIRENRTKRRIIDAYRRRSWFYAPYKTSYYVLNTEELATIYHFPGNVAQTPTISRVSSKKAEAPPNLPTEE